LRNLNQFIKPTISPNRLVPSPIFSRETCGVPSFCAFEDTPQNTRKISRNIRASPAARGFFDVWAVVNMEMRQCEQRLQPFRVQ